MPCDLTVSGEDALGSKNAGWGHDLPHCLHGRRERVRMPWVPKMRVGGMIYHTACTVVVREHLHYHGFDPDGE